MIYTLELTSWYLYINMINIILKNGNNVYQYKPFHIRSICILSFNHRCNTQVHTQTFYEIRIGGCVLGVHVIFDRFNTAKLNWTNEFNVILQYHVYNKNKPSLSPYVD